MARIGSGVTAVLERVRRLEDKTAQSLGKELERIEKAKERLTTDLDAAAERIRRTLGELGGRMNGARTVKPAAGRTRRRIRRNPEQLAKEASAIFQLIKSKGDKGATGRDIRTLTRRSGVHQGLLQSTGDQRFDHWEEGVDAISRG